MSPGPWAPGTVGYFLNTYPLVSTTFIRDEILAHEAAGVPVPRFAVRTGPDNLVDPRDIEEQRLTTYVLEHGLAGLILPTLRELATNPLRFLRAAKLAFNLARRAPDRKLHHAVYLMEAAKLKRLTRDADVKHLHVHFSTNATTVALLSWRLGGPSYSFTVHGPDELPVLVSNGIVQKAASSAFIAAISDYCRSVLVRDIGPEGATTIHIVRCGLNLDDFPDGGADAEREPGHLVCVGRLCPQKAQTTLIEAMARVTRSHPGARLTLIGDGESRPEVEALIAQHGLSETVTLAGWRSGEDVRAAVAKAHAFVLPSLAEGLPVAIMEALALRTPVISTRIAGIPELLDASCGWIIEPGSVEELTAALMECLDSEPARLVAMGDVGRQRVLRDHDQRKNAESLRKLILASLGRER